LIGRTCEEEPSVALDDARIVAGRKPLGTGAPGKCEQLGEAEAAVAADARVGRPAGRIAAHERLDDGAAKLVAQVERDVRQAEPVEGPARGDDCLRREGGALVAGTVSVQRSAQRAAY